MILVPSASQKLPGVYYRGKCDHFRKEPQLENIHSFKRIRAKGLKVTF